MLVGAEFERVGIGVGGAVETMFGSEWLARETNMPKILA